MKYDPAADGPEVKLIAFFSMYPEGSFSRRVSNVTETELRMRFILHKALGKIIRFNWRIPNAISDLGTKRAVSGAPRRKANRRRVRSHS